MTLEESMDKLDELHRQEIILLEEVKKCHIHNTNDERVYYRYVYADNIKIKEYILKRIKEGKTEWKSLADEYPLPDKPFDMDDIQDSAMKECFMRLQELTKEEKALGDYINDNFDFPEINRAIKQHFDEKYG